MFEGASPILPKYNTEQAISELYLQKSGLYMATLAFLLVTAIISLSIVPVRAAEYTPAVTAGHFAQFKLLYYNCESTDPSFCQMDTSGIQDVDWGALRVVQVLGTSVTLSMITVYKNGTATHEGVLVDVRTGFSNVTGFGTGEPTNYFLLAGNLHAPDPIWDTSSAPTLNATAPRTVLGVQRDVNFLNYTSSFSSELYSLSLSFGFAFDMVSGVFVEISFSSYSSGFGVTSETAFAMGMVDNNIWLSSTLPDFSIDANPTTVNVDEGSLGTSTITISRIAGFSRTVTLTATSSPNTLSCSLSPPSLADGGSDTSTLSCSGSPGTYTVTVMADGGYTSHETSIIFNVAASTTPDFAISNSGMNPFQTGSTGTATITLTALNGFSSTIGLQVSSTPLGLTCSLDRNSIAGSGSATLTCQGLPGTYTVTVTATSGPTTHTTQSTVTVNAVSAPSPPSQPASQQFPILYIGAGIAAVVIIGLAALLVLRRKPEETPQV